MVGKKLFSPSCANNPNFFSLSFTGVLEFGKTKRDSLRVLRLVQFGERIAGGDVRRKSGHHGTFEMGQQPTSLARWTRSIHFTKNHSFHVGKEAVALRQLQQVVPLRPVR
jgi:hypothetical protein